MVREGVGEELSLDYQYQIGGMTLYPQKVNQLNLYELHARKGTVPQELTGRFTSLQAIGKAIESYLRKKEIKETKAAETGHKRQRSKEIAAHIEQREAEKEVSNG